MISVNNASIPETNQSRDGVLNGAIYVAVITATALAVIGGLSAYSVGQLSCISSGWCYWEVAAAVSLCIAGVLYQIKSSSRTGQEDPPYSEHREVLEKSRPIKNYVGTATTIQNNPGETNLSSVSHSRDDASSLSIKKKSKKDLQRIDHKFNDHRVGLNQLTLRHRKLHNNEVIKRINEARLKGKKICLFIGRYNHQTKPHKESEEWFTLDSTMCTECLTTHHLHMDFNKNLDIKAIIRLFDQIVVDIEVVKYVNNDYICAFFRVFLVDNPSSTLIVPAYSGAVCIHHPWEEDQSTHYNPKRLGVKVSQSIINIGEAVYQEASDKLEKEDIGYALALKKWFDKVEIKHELYRWRGADGEKEVFWELSGPKFKK